MSSDHRKFQRTVSALLSERSADSFCLYFNKREIISMTISELKQKSGAKLFASILGKSTISKESEEYATISRFSEILLENGYGIIHGGYTGGAMSAASDSANHYINKHNLSQCLNIAVPQKQHDNLWERVREAQFTDTAEDIFQRLKIVTSGDIAIVCPQGGDGTELEETIVFHENVIHEEMNKHGGHNEKVTPLIFFQTKNGTDWKCLIETKIKVLDILVKNMSDYKWLHFVNSFEEFEKIIKDIKKELGQII